MYGVVTVAPSASHWCCIVDLALRHYRLLAALRRPAVRVFGRELVQQQQHPWDVRVCLLHNLSLLSPLFS
jgi:hypothetical protein